MNNTIKVGVIIKNKDNKILLIKEGTEKNNKPLLNIIKGTYGDIKKESLIQAAKREALEEAGLNIDIIGLFKCYTQQRKDGIWLQFVFLAKTNGRIKLPSKKEQIKRKENITEANWFSIDEIKKIKKSEFISNNTYTIINDYIKEDNFYSTKLIQQII